MFEIRLHGALWKTVDAGRAAEWRRSLDELNARNTIAAVSLDVGDDPALELVRPPDGSYQFRVYRDGFDQLDRRVLDADKLAYLFEEYGATIRQMVHVDREAPVRGFEALDYAKRVVHDEAADFLMESLSEVLNLELSDARRLFTLIFLVGTDLPEKLVRYHRAH